jgi:glycosyltransferase involved in cell wall biosynthesis/GT2 family glycosyltransferase
VPLVSALLAVHNDARFVGEAVSSMLSQTVRDLEVVVIDDASTDATAETLDRFDDPRLVVIRAEERAGLAASLNLGLERASGRYVARLDSDDIARPDRLERQLARMQGDARVAVVGSSVTDVDEDGVPGQTHVLPQGATPLRWHALFSSPFFHPTVLVDRDVLEQHGLRYDPAFLESEDYDLWARLFAVADGDNLRDALVLKRVHGGQASLRRADVQESFARRVALREIGRVAPGLSVEDAELAWRLGSGRGDRATRAGTAFVQLLDAFEREYGADARVREAAARALARGRHVRHALRLVPSLPLRLALGRHSAPSPAPSLAPSAEVRVTVVSPEPTPYRSPLFDRIAREPALELTVIYAAHSVASRTWSVVPQHEHVFLRGLRLPLARKLVRHDYPVTPGIARALRRSRPDVLVVSGWSTYASQAAIAWARAHGVPYLLLVESHDLGSRAGWRRRVKRAVVPGLLRHAASVLVVGSAARESVVGNGISPERVRVFANTIDIPAWSERASRLQGEGRDGDEVVVLSAARLVPEKGLDLLVRAVARSGDERLRLVVAGAGPEAERLARLAEGLHVELRIAGDLSEDDLARAYAGADVFSLLSRHEPWGVVVNEAAASGLPLVLSDTVGAAHDLLRDGENGFLVADGDIEEAAAALKRLAADPELRRRFGQRSRELVGAWGYEPSVERFAVAVREATAR